MPGAPAGAVEVEVVTVTLAGRFGSPVVVLREKRSSRALPLYVGPAEAAAIWQRLSRERALRAPVQDLLKSLLDASDASLERAVLTGRTHAGTVASLRLRVRGRAVAVESRPSDAIALALRCGRPIFASRELMRSAASFDLAARAHPVSAGGLTLQELTPALAARLGTAAGAGALVGDVRAGRFEGRVRRGDVLEAVGGRPVTGVVDALVLLQEAKGGALRLTLRRDGRRRSVAVPPDGAP